MTARRSWPVSSLRVRLEQGGLAAAGGADEVDGEDTARREFAADHAGEFIVYAEDVFNDGDFAAHGSWTSMEINCSSEPPSTCGVAHPHWQAT